MSGCVPLPFNFSYGSDREAMDLNITVKKLTQYIPLYCKKKKKKKNKKKKKKKKN
jgi:hypothetical protein